MISAATHFQEERSMDLIVLDRKIKNGRFYCSWHFIEYYVIRICEEKYQACIQMSGGKDRYDLYALKKSEGDPHIHSKRSVNKGSLQISSKCDAISSNDFTSISQTMMHTLMICLTWVLGTSMPSGTLVDELIFHMATKSGLCFRNLGIHFRRPSLMFLKRHN